MQIFAILSLILYGLSCFFAKEIETAASFPGVFRNSTPKKNVDINLEIIQIKGKDGNTLHGVFLNKNAKKTVYYFHGNGGSLPHFYDEIKYIGDLGYNVFSYDYPGYGISQGFPDKESIDDASEKIYKHLKIRKDWQEKDIIVWGYSIGSAAAIDFASKHKNIDRMILLAPISSRYDMSTHLFGFPLQKLLAKEDSFVSYEQVKHFDFPVFIVHAKDDKLVPFWQGQKVFDNYKGEKYLLDLKSGGHNTILKKHGEKLRSPFRVFLSMEKTKNPSQ
ncbi:hypothetical protein CSB09_04090 [Candidatus Gracilibacteria bacterium]|nr:MAG: hypothetical protein CSB09_04090 [Candidatus Gracilibacteria bacterium]